MDANRFDLLVRALMEHSSRRQALGFLSGAFAAATAGPLWRQEAAAKRVRLGKKCNRRNRKNRKKDKCRGGGKCRGGRCKCTNGRDQCGDTCCASGQICVAGICLTGQGTCASGADSCIGDTIVCNETATCACFQSTEGTTRCGEPRGATECGNCTSSTQCAAAFPQSPAIFCAVDISGPAGCGCNPGETTCVPPCPF